MSEACYVGRLISVGAKHLIYLFSLISYHDKKLKHERSLIGFHGLMVIWTLSILLVMKNHLCLIILEVLKSGLGIYVADVKLEESIFPSQECFEISQPFRSMSLGFSCPRHSFKKLTRVIKG